MRAVMLLFGLFVAMPRAGDDVVQLVASWRNPRLSISQREAIEDQLLASGADGALALRRAVEEEAAALGKKLDANEKRYLDDFAKSATKLVETRLDRKALAELDTLRKSVLALRMDPDLTKEKIHEVGDPAMQRVNELLIASVDQVREADAKLEAKRGALLDDCTALEEAFSLWKRCNEALPDKQRSQSFADPLQRDAHVLVEETWLASLATPMGDRDRKILLANREHDGELDPEEAAGVLDVNLLRIRLGLNALALDLKLCTAARGHSSDMRTLGFFAHESPVEGKKTPWDRAARAGTSASAENIARGQSTGAGANEGWWYSPGHHKNMLGGHATIGLGRSDTFWTQMFG